MPENSTKKRPVPGKIIQVVKQTRDIFHPTPKKTMQTRLDAYRLNNPSPINKDSYYDVEMAQPVKAQYMDRSFSPIEVPSKPTSPYSDPPSAISSRSQSPIEQYMNSLDDSDVKYGDNEWGFHDKEFKGGKKTRNRVKTRRVRSSRRKTRSRRQNGGDNDRLKYLMDNINNEEKEIEEFKIEKQRVIREKEEKENKVITTRLVTEKGKKRDGRDLVPIAKRDSATLVSPFLRMSKEELDEYNDDISYYNAEISAGENYINTLYKEYIAEAIEVGDIDNVISALERGADVNTRTGDTPILHRAVIRGNVEIVKILLKQPNIDVNAQQGRDMGSTALIKALKMLKYHERYKKTIEIIKLLLKDKRTDVSIDTVYSTALDAAMHNKAPPEIIDLIKERVERKKNIAMARLVTEKAKLEDGRDLVPVAKRDVATSISKFFGGKRKTRKIKQKGRGVGKSKQVEKPDTPPKKTRKNVQFLPETKSPSSPKQNKTKRIFISKNKDKLKAVAQYENRKRQQDLEDMRLGKIQLEGGNKRKKTAKKSKGRK